MVTISFSTTATCRTKPCVQEKIRAKKEGPKFHCYNILKDCQKIQRSKERLGAPNPSIRNSLHSCVARDTESKEQIGSQAWRSDTMKVRDAFSRDLEPNARAFGESKWIANKDWKQVDTVYKVSQDTPHARALD